MCGISGGLAGGEPDVEALVNRLNQAQAHRGPDDEVVHRVGSWVIGNTRLAIQDPTPSGNQPAWSSDGRFCAVFNGEIYNYLELASELGFGRSRLSDTAVIPELWSRHGEASLPRLRGMYAIAIVDREADTLTLARDPFGIKPLYWVRTRSRPLLFASEPRPLAATAGRLEVSPKAIDRFLHLGAIGPSESPFADVRALAPGEALTFHRSGQRTVCSVPRRPVAGEPRGTSSSLPDLANALQESVALHLRSDVPTALLLSGGVDSAAIASAAQRLGHRLHCLTVAGALGEKDETAVARQSARQYGHDHEAVEAHIEPEGVRAFFAAMQRPSIDGMNTFIVCRCVRNRGYKVALSGLGADECLGGYRHFRLLRLLSFLRAVDRAVPAAAWTALGRILPAGGGTRGMKMRRFLLAGGARSAWDFDLLQREVFTLHEVGALRGGNVRDFSYVVPPDDIAESSSLEVLVSAELTFYLQSTLLPDADTFSMCSSVELRVPFVDQAFFEVGVRATARERGHRGKDALARSLGDSRLIDLARRRKQGFSIPISSWMKDGPLASYVADAVRPDAPLWEYVDRRRGLAVLSNEGDDGWARRWALVALNAWVQSARSP